MKVHDVYLNDYYFLLFWMAFSFLFLGVLFVLALFLSSMGNNFEKNSSYECGFEPFGSMSSFSTHSYIMALSFLIFDLELVYIYPWAIYWGVLPMASFLIMMSFFFIIMLGFIYEWDRGALTVV